MLYIIEGANYVGKTTTLDILKKKKSFLHFYHPRFNDAQHFEFQYNRVTTMFGRNAIDTPTIHVPRDVVYQISHMTCLKYLTSIKEKKVLLDRCFLSEMVYNELYDKKIYHEFVNVLNTYEYTIFLLTVKDDEILRQRIIARLKKDATKGFGIRTGDKGFVPEPETVEEKMKAQREIELKYLQLIGEFALNSNIIDTSSLSKRQVAELISTYK